MQSLQDPKWRAAVGTELVGDGRGIFFLKEKGRQDRDNCIYWNQQNMGSAILLGAATTLTSTHRKLFEYHVQRPQSKTRKAQISELEIQLQKAHS